MKPSTLALRNLLATRQFFSAPLLSFSLAGGPTLRYTSADIDLTVGGNLYSAGGTTGPYFFRDQTFPAVSWTVGTKVSEMSFDVSPGASIVEGLPFLTSARIGAFDGAEFSYQRAYMPQSNPADTSAGAVMMFLGRVADIQMGRSVCTFTIASHMEILNKPFPRNLYQAGCVNTLYDGSCNISPGPFTFSGNAAGGSSPRLIIAAGSLPGAAGFYDLGKIKMTSGVNNGLVRPVRSWNGVSQIALSAPFPSAPTVGDSFDVTRGCNKTTAACNSFANIINFRGFPTVPVPETSI